MVDFNKVWGETIVDHNIYSKDFEAPAATFTRSEGCAVLPSQGRFNTKDSFSTYVSYLTPEAVDGSDALLFS